MGKEDIITHIWLTGATVLDADHSSDADGASDVENPYLYTGRRLDAESGLMQYRNRYYAPGLGRFVSRDPAGYSDSMCLYGYVYGAPPNGMDPSGLYQIEWHGQWSRKGKERVRRAMMEAAVRAQELVYEIEDLQEELRQLDHYEDCYTELGRNLEHVKWIMQNVVSHVYGADRHKHLVVKKANLDPGTWANWKRKKWWDYHARTLKLNYVPAKRVGANWFAAKPERRARKMFHELTHDLGTEDPPDAKTDWNDAHQLERLYTQGVGNNWIPYMPERRAADDCCDALSATESSD